MGADVVVCAPPTLLPLGIERLCGVTWRIDEALEGADVVMALRIQRERMGAGLFPSIREYARLYGIDRGRFDEQGGVAPPVPVRLMREAAPIAAADAAPPIAAGQMEIRARVSVTAALK